MQIEKEDCYKEGWLGTTINDVSKKLHGVSSVIQWLNIMYELACKDKSNKKDDRGMKCLKTAIGKQKLNQNNYTDFPSLTKLVEILDTIKKGSEKAWRGRTKQKGFQKTLEKSYEIAANGMKEPFIKRNNPLADSRTLGIGMLWETIRQKVNKNVENEGVVKTLENLGTLITRSIGDRTIFPSECSELLKRLENAFSPYSIPKAVKKTIDQKVGYVVLGNLEFKPSDKTAYDWLFQEWINSHANKESIGHQFKYDDIRPCDIAKINAICKICEENYGEVNKVEKDLPKIENELYYLKDLYKLLSTLYNLFSKKTDFAMPFIDNLSAGIKWTVKSLNDTIKKLSEEFGKNNAKLLDFIKKINPENSVSNGWEKWIATQEKQIKKLCTNNEDKNLVDEYWSAEGLPNN